MEVRHYFWLSTAAAVLTITLKTIAWWLTGSVGLLSDAMESLVNLAAALFALTMVTIAKSPPDAEHPLGHSKAEYFSSGAEGMMIFGAAAAIIWSAGQRLLSPQPLESVGLGLVFSAASTMLNFGVAQAMYRASVKFRSIALQGGARHLMTDVWTSVGVVGGVFIVALTGQLWLDAVIAIAVGLHILAEGWRLIRTSANGLMDAALPPETLEQIEAVLRRHAASGVRFVNLRTRSAGSQSFVYVNVLVPPTWTIVQAHDLLDEIERDIHHIVPDSQVFTHPEPDRTQA
ncbi:cation diffusion facilitator family transporter [Paucimonas lemoignei]|uniref:Cation diffusion facilitator family transporter n=1 Tax=Paucimonas lemoignei TaxID=29443 RepID=A0A4R3HP48_PAULE|nr:cation diffusion facilitator family transporter [Paucimonas lemoignei]TCS32608.1 cation diffusion facilitator family transporter [Paucimonas lemoignei]